MGPLQQALLGVGGLIIVAVAAHNVWQSWQLRRRRGATSGEAPMAAETEPRLEPGLEDAAAPAEMQRLRQPSPRIDPLIDAIASFLFEHPVPGEALLERLPRSARAGTKPLLFEGRNAETGAWEALAGGQRYAELQAGVQLASRGGALNAIEYSEFVTKCHALGEALATPPDLPDMAEVLDHARELDTFAAANDAQLSINLQAQGVAWGVDFLRQQAAAAGFGSVVGAGRLALVETVGGEDGQRPVPVVQLHFDAQAELADNPEVPVARATLLLDVAQVPRELEPFRRMREAASRLAQALDARQVDDNGTPLSPTALDRIEEQLGQLYATLDARGLAAGSAAAARLFS